MKFLGLLSILPVLFLSSCGEDDEAPSNDITFDGTTYTMTEGLIEDYGRLTFDDGMQTRSFYNYDFTITDGSFVFDSDGFIEGFSSNTNVVVYGYFVVDAEAFENGVFEWPESFETIPEGDYLLFDFFLSRAGVSNLDIFIPGSGNVRVAGQDLNRRLTYQMDLFDLADSLDVSPPEFPLRGSFGGEFQYADLRENPLARSLHAPKMWQSRKEKRIKDWLSR